MGFVQVVKSFYNLGQANVILSRHLLLKVTMASNCTNLEKSNLIKKKLI